MAEWKLRTLHALHYGTGPDRAPWRAIFGRTEGGEEQEIGLLYSELKAKVERRLATRCPPVSEKPSR
jgi:hypothetical protein